MKKITPKDEIPYVVGCVPDKPDKRDKIYEDAMGAPPSDMPSFEVGFDNEEKYGKLISDDQRSTWSCVGQGSSNDAEMDVLIATGKKVHFSPKWVYSQIHLPSGGASPRDAYYLMNKQGICEYDLLPSENASGSVLEDWMRDTTQITEKARENALQYKIGAYYSILTYEPEVFAQAIFENGGVGGGYRGVNANIGHFIWFSGYKMHKGYKALKYKDSIPGGYGDGFDKFIIKHDGKFYLDSPNGSQIYLYSHWTFQHGQNYPIDKTMTELTKKEGKEEHYLTMNGERYWIKKPKDMENFIKAQPIKDLNWKTTRKVTHFTTPFNGKIIGDVSFIEFLKAKLGSKFGKFGK